MARNYIKKPDKLINNHLLGWQRQNDIIKMLLDGRDSTEIAEFVCNKYNVQKSSAHVYISNAREEIKKYNENKADYVISMHLERYEFLFTKLVELGAHSLAMTVLQAKEKLMGMHSGDFRMKVTNTEVTNTKNSMGSAYDQKLLSEEEQQLLNKLIEKAKVGK